MDSKNWKIHINDFNPDKLHHMETIFTIGNGFLATRGAFEEGYPLDKRATLIHGVFDATPLVFTELANAPDWLPLTILIHGEAFAMDHGKVHTFEQTLDLRTGLLSRSVRWESPRGDTATFIFERFASLAAPHILCQRLQITPEFVGQVEVRAAINGCSDNEGLAHWRWFEQGKQGEALFLVNETRQSQIRLASAMQVAVTAGEPLDQEFWDVQNAPTIMFELPASPGETLVIEKYVSIATSRDATDVRAAALAYLDNPPAWEHALQANNDAWDQEWSRCDVVIEGDDEAQIAIRFNLYHLLIAAPRSDDRVNIGAKSLSGFGYRGHSFWDTEIFILPLFIYTAPHIARNLLNYRFRNLPAARQNARMNGHEGARFPWESADTGEEVTPTWLPHPTDRTKLVRIWTGDIELHISADIAYAAFQYWLITGDDEWLVAKGAELILDTAKFWASRAEWNEALQRYEYTDVIGPDEYHEHVDNNFFTNRMAQWNLQTALEILGWLKNNAPEKAAELYSRLDLNEDRLEHWRSVIELMYLPVGPDGLIEQFEGYFQRKEVNLAGLEPREQSVQALFGIEETNLTQVLKQPDVLMLLYLLRNEFSSELVRRNYAYYTPRTDHTFGSSLGPAIQAIMACEVGLPDEAYEHFIRAARADLYDVRSNAGDGIHAASAGGTWLAIVFGFAGLRASASGWSTSARLPHHWKRLVFNFCYHGQPVRVDLEQPATELPSSRILRG